MCERITHFCIVAVLFNYFSKIERACIGAVCAHAVEIDGEFAVHQVHSALHVGHLASYSPPGISVAPVLVFEIRGDLTHFRMCSLWRCW